MRSTEEEIERFSEGFCGTVLKIKQRDGRLN